MYIERVPNRRVPNRNSPPAVLLRESFREGGKIRKRTIANLSGLPDGIIDGFRDVLKGQAVQEHVCEVLGLLAQGVVRHQPAIPLGDR